MNKSKTKPLRVASLNFSGINVSPFEYHDGSKQKESINKCFTKLLNQYQKQNPDSTWNIAKIDKVLQRERYSILYKPTAGVVRGRLLDKNQYEAVWDTIFQENQHLVKHLTPTQQSINLLRTFDWMMYQAFVTTMYGKINWNNIKQYNSKRYVQELKKWHQKKYLKWQPKINFVKDYLIRQNLDILFLQEAGNQKLQASIPENYVPFRAGQAMIIVRKTFVVQDPQVSKFHLTFGSRLNFNHDSHYVKLKHYLLCSAHLSSKSANVKQALEMQSLFRQIRQQYDGINIIAGVDANHFLSDFSYLNVFPKIKSHATTRKKRTSMQLQFQKSQKLIEQAKDHIITNLIFQDVKVETINCEDAIDQLLPNQQHPYDHFVVFGTLKLKNKSQDDEQQNDNIDDLNILGRHTRQSFAPTSISFDDNLNRSRQTSQPQTTIKRKDVQLQFLNVLQQRTRKQKISSQIQVKPPSSKILTFNPSEKTKDNFLKAQTITQIHKIRPQHYQHNKQHNSNQRMNPNQNFLQFSRPKVASHNKSQGKEVKEQQYRMSLTFTPKPDKQKTLNQITYKKY